MSLSPLNGRARRSKKNLALLFAFRTFKFYEHIVRVFWHFWFRDAAMNYGLSSATVLWQKIPSGLLKVSTKYYSPQDFIDSAVLRTRIHGENNVVRYWTLP